MVPSIPQQVSIIPTNSLVTPSVLGFGRGLNVSTVQYVCQKGHSEIPFAETGPSLTASALPETNSEKFPSAATVLN